MPNQRPTRKQPQTKPPASPPDMRLPKLGEIVFYVLSNGRSAGEIRPAIVVKTFGSDRASLVVFTTALNDQAPVAFSVNSVKVCQNPTDARHGEAFFADQ